MALCDRTSMITGKTRRLVSGTCRSSSGRKIRVQTLSMFISGALVGREHGPPAFMTSLFLVEEQRPGRREDFQEPSPDTPARYQRQRGARRPLWVRICNSSQRRKWWSTRQLDLVRILVSAHG